MEGNMRRFWAALLLAGVVGFTSGCGGSSSSSFTGPRSPSTLTVTDQGTRDFVTVDSTGTSIFVPSGAVNQTTTFSFSSLDPFGIPFANNQRFVSGLTFQGFTDLGRPAELRIPVFTSTTLLPGATIAVFQQTATGLVQIPVTSFSNGIVTFQTTTPGSFVVVQQTTVI
jgi:hypothetical protein